MDSNAVAIAALTLTGTIATGFFTLIRQQNKTHEKLSNSLDKVAETNKLIAIKTERVANATERTADESKQRNGHIVEMIIESRDTVVKSVQKVHAQKVDEQVVEHQVVKEKG